MKREKGDYKSLLKEIVTARDRDLTSILAETIENFLKSLDWEDAVKVVDELTGRERMPTNIWGAIKNIWADLKTVKDNQHLTKTKWKNNPDCASPVEWALFWAILNEILLWHKTGLAEYNQNGITAPFDIIEWNKAGQPQTWSMILDHFLTGYSKAHNINKPYALENYLRKYLDMLTEERGNRTKPKHVKQKEPNISE